MAKRQPKHLTPIPMQYRNPSIITCPGCHQPINRDHEEHVQSRVTGSYYCDKTCVLLAESLAHSVLTEWRWHDGELKLERQILNELEVVSYA